jgi:hypothetical protein
MAGHLTAATTLAGVTTSSGAGPGKTLLIFIVTFGLIFVVFAALAAGFNTTIQSVAAR